MPNAEVVPDVAPVDHPGLVDGEGYDAAPESQVRLALASPGSARTQDAALVRAALVGDRSAAPAIVRRYRPLVRRYVGACLSPADEVDDHVQEVFARCFEHLGRLRDPSSLRSFIIGITLRLVGTERRRRRVRRIERLTATGELPEPLPPDDGVETRHTIWRTREMLGKLKPESSRVLELRFVQEHKLSEVAEQMGVSVATAKRQLARASARVRALAALGRAEWPGLQSGRAD
ncbi:MAG TPA: sigma-70 family RNA polymerase sigma factor [Polyangiaceae bacterium]|nr:sigma-70 family RNA polymerase sigma factor [Polyangiaceae bacterium]